MASTPVSCSMKKRGAYAPRFFICEEQEMGVEGITLPFLLNSAVRCERQRDVSGGTREGSRRSLPPQRGQAVPFHAQISRRSRGSLPADLTIDNCQPCAPPKARLPFPSFSKWKRSYRRCAHRTE